jgi:PKD repeat protein
MSLRGDDRGVVIQVGAVLLFAFVIMAITMYQVQVIPDQNEEIEYNHNEQVQDQLLDVRSGILTTAGGGGSRSVSVTLGTNYPSRTIFLNPSPPSGKLRTIGTTNESINVTIANAKGTRSETSDFWNGTNRSFSTGALVYEPFYHRYDNAPTTIYEHSLLANQFDDVALAKTDQTIVQDETITLVTLNGSYQEASTRTVALDTQSLSTSTKTIPVTNETGNLTLSLPTLLGNETWGPLLEPELETKGGNVSNYEVLDSPNGPNTLIIELVPGTYTLQMAKVGVGSNTAEPPESAHYITSQATNKSVQSGGTVSLTVEVRDRYNNPVPLENVTFRPTWTSSTNVATNRDGKATVKLNAPPAGQEKINATIKNGKRETQKVVFDLTVKGSPSENGSEAYTTTWQNPSNPATITCSEVPPDGECTFDAGGQLFADLELSMKTNPIADGAKVSYAVSNQSVFKVQPDTGRTNSSGENSTQLWIYRNGVENVYVDSGSNGDILTVNLVNLATTLPAEPVDNGSGTDSGVKFSFQNTLEKDLTLAGIYVGPQNSAIDELSDPSDFSTGEYNVEVFIQDSTGIYDYDWGDGRSLPHNFVFEESDNNPPWFDDDDPYPGPIIQSSETASITLYEFLDDGTPYNMSGENVDITLGFADGTTKNVTLNVQGGGSGNAAPTASFTYSPTDPNVGESVTFDASGSGDTDGTIDSYDWDFDNDGTIDATGPQVTNTFDSQGDYPVTLTVTDDQGATDSQTQTVSVQSSGETGRPQLTSATVENTPLNQSDTGETQAITLEFDRQMDTSVDPTVGVTDLEDSADYNTSIETNGDWANNTTWRSEFTLADSEEDVTATLDVRDAEDTNGNTMEEDTSTTVVVDTIRPDDPSDVRIQTDPINASNQNGVNVEVDVEEPDPDGGTVFVRIADPDGNAVTDSTPLATGSGTVTTTITGIDVSSLNDADPDADGGVIATARIVDDAGNENPSGFTSESDEVLKDTVLPSIDEFTLENPSGNTLEVEIVTDESLSAIDVDIEDSDGNVVTLGEGDFSDTENSGTYTYTSSHTATENDDYTAVLNVAEDDAGNDGASGESDTATVFQYSNQVLQPVGEVDNSGDRLEFRFENTAGEDVTIEKFEVDASPIAEGVEIDDGNAAEVEIPGNEQEGEANRNGNPDTYLADGTRYDLVEDSNQGNDGQYAILGPKDELVAYFRYFTTDLGTLQFTADPSSADLIVRFVLGDGSEQVFYFEQT